MRERFTAALPRSPVLVVPNVDDVFGFEREFSTAAGAMLGGSVATFSGLFEMAARAAGEVPPARLGETQRLRLAAAAIERSRPRILARSARRPGFAAAALELIDELQSASLDPVSVAEGARGLEESAYLDELARLFAAYTELRDGCGRGDSHVVAAVATAAVRRDPASWGGRPVFLYGFDDLTVEQRGMVAALAATAEVTVAVTYEDRLALTARATLLADLRELGEGGIEITEQRTEANPANTESPLLFHLERGFAEPAPDPRALDGTLVLLRSAGERGEAESLAGEIAALLAGGAHPASIAVALRDPAGRGALLGRILDSCGIPVAVEGDLPITATATGDCVLALLRAAFGSRSAADVLRYLRGPRRASSASVDGLERAILRGRITTAEGAAEAWTESNERPIRPLEDLRAAEHDPAALLRIVADLARDIAEWPLARDETRGKVPGAGHALELRAASAIAAAADELEQLDVALPAAAGLVDVVEGLTMPLWRGPAEERVRIASPYRLRAGRFEHLFVASLQDGEFPSHGRGSPFLTDDQRGALGLRRRAETEDEERYLFYVCLTLPTRTLALSWRDSDESGGAEQPSPFLDDVTALLSGGGEALVRGRSLGAVVFAPSEAPSEDELARALAARAGEGDREAGEVGAELAALSVPADTATAIGGRIEAAAARVRAGRAPGPLRNPAVVEELTARREFGGTTLEAVAECSYRWFVHRELRPEPLGPQPEPLAQGNVMHRALERLYRAKPGGDAVPRPASLDAWIARGGELVAEAAAENGLSPANPADIAVRRRVERLLTAFLRREAARPPLLEPVLLEASFGSEPEADKPSLDLGGWLLHGRIDRVDSDGALALLHDYKMARAVTAAAKLEKEGKLQLQLYLIALRELWGLQPAAGLYQPLRATRDSRARGLARASDRDGVLEGWSLVGTDVLEDGAFEQVLADAQERATAIVGRIRGGDIRRDPLEDECPKYCTFAPICRRERGLIADPEAELREEEP